MQDPFPEFQRLIKGGKRMAQEKDDAKGMGSKKPAGDQQSKDAQDGKMHSQHRDQERDEQHRMGQFGQAGDHPRDTGRGSRHK